MVAGRTDIRTMLKNKERGVLFNRVPLVRRTPVVYFDNEHSQKYSVLEIVAEDALGLLYRISRVISKHGCDLDLVLVNTEGHKAIDVFHVTRAGRKLLDNEQTDLSAHLQRMLEGRDEAD